MSSTTNKVFAQGHHHHAPVGVSGPVTTCAAQAAAAHSAHVRQNSTASVYQDPHMTNSREGQSAVPIVDARPILPLAAFFMGDLRDGLPMLNMQAAYLISAKDFNEKQMGILFFCFGISQFLCMAPAGYFLDYSNRKIDWVLAAGATASFLTVVTAVTAEEGGKNMAWMILLKIIQGGITAILPPGFNGITLGIVGSTGFTHQVSRNRMMNHIGTAIIVASGSLLAYFLYPNIGALFMVSPIAAMGMAYHLRRIKPTHVDRDAARGLIIESPTMDEYERYDEEQEEAAVAAAVESWHMMQDEPDYDPKKVEDQQNQILNKLSNLSYTNNSTCPNDTCSYNEFTSPCGRHCTPTKPPMPSSPAASATSSSYMPPDVMNSNSPEKFPHQRHTMLLTTPIHEHEEGYQFQTNEIRQQPNSPLPPSQPDSAPPNAQPFSGRSKTRTYDSQPSFNMGYGAASINALTKIQNSQSVLLMGVPEVVRKARTPLAVLMDKTLMTFTAVVFFFHMANSSVLPLVMQSLALQDAQAGILLSGLCILIAQAFMSYFAKVCGDYSPVYGRKNLVLIGLASLTLRCFLLAGLVTAQKSLEDDSGETVLKVCILATQFLDAVGAGLLGCLHILVTNDISGGTGRFSLMLGVTTGAMCLGGTVSGYIGQAVAQDYGYPFAFTSLGVISLIPLFLYVFFMPETLPDYARPNQQTFMKRRKRIAALFKKFSESKRKLVAKANTFKKRLSKDTTDPKKQALHTPSDPPTQATTQIPASNVELV